MPWIKQDDCVGCMVCSTVCPAEAITQAENRTALINQEQCTGCGRCISVCPPGAIHPDSEDPAFGGAARTGRKETVPGGTGVEGFAADRRILPNVGEGRNRELFRGPGQGQGRGPGQGGGAGRGQGRGRGRSPGQNRGRRSI